MLRASCAWQVLGIPYSVDTQGFREYMQKFGDIEDVVVLKVHELRVDPVLPLLHTL